MCYIRLLHTLSGFTVLRVFLRLLLDEFGEGKADADEFQDAEGGDGWGDDDLDLPVSSTSYSHLLFSVES